MLQVFEQAEGKMLAEHEAALRVGLRRRRLGDSVAEAARVLQAVADALQGDLGADGLLDGGLHLFAVLDGRARLQQLLRLGDDSSGLQLLLCLLCL